MPTDELASLWVLRHGQSLGNVANDAARVRPVDRLDIAERDMDVPLSALGGRAGRRLRCVARHGGATSARTSSSPRLTCARPRRPGSVRRGRAGRAHRSRRAAARARVRRPRPADPAGDRRRAPQEAERRQRLGKFYYRPPGGESWVDVALRLRSLRDSLVRQHADRRVLLVTHEVPIIIMRYLIEDLDEPAALALEPHASLANCSLTTYVRATPADSARSRRLDGPARAGGRPRSRMSPMPPSPPAEAARRHAPAAVPAAARRRGTSAAGAPSLVIGGSAATPGAALLAGRAALAGRRRPTPDRHRPGVAVGPRRRRAGGVGDVVRRRIARRAGIDAEPSSSGPA